ncbi:MAG: hypothetical protein B6D61_06470 [Bacteroidetes bacterium 4484_249]|nr:MAG: hypothetical protein B6D61_06470 [Bacteroidetes bacterium 4484_249]
MSKYLYGASVQGIQGFIFETNKLKEIVGASQLVDNINEIVFKKFCKDKVGHVLVEDNVILNAAGNIRYIVEDVEVIKSMVKYFPKYITNYAPGITISQAVVEYEDDLKGAISELERKIKTQRNKAQTPADIGFMALERVRRTGKVGFFEVRDKKTNKIEDVIDRGTFQKTENRELDTTVLFSKFAGRDIGKDVIPFDIEDITNKGENSSWIAVIHADSNGLGNVLQNLDKNLNADEKVKDVRRRFSNALKDATKSAAQEAFKSVINETWQDKIESSNEQYPIRPVVLGGDDLTVIIRADLALKFTESFLNAFEKETDKHFESLRQYGLTALTACAGIAYIKDNYPFHYGVHLAESLTKEAKKFSKSKEVQGGENMPPSSVAFYKVQSSFTESLEDMIKRTHYVNGNKYLFASPYLIKPKNGYRTTKELKTLVKNMEKYTNDKSKGISKLRQWITEVHNDGPKAEFMMNRIREVNKGFYNDLDLEKERKAKTTILLDAIDLHVFNVTYAK